MFTKRIAPARRLPGWVVAVVSLWIVAHFFAIGVHVLSARSGPWLVPNIGPSTAEGPPFATELSKETTRYYLQPLRMTSDYHYASNHVDSPAVYFEAKLKDDNGNVTQTLQFPAAKENAWLRHRHAVLAEGLGGDVPIPMPRGEMIPAKGQEAERVLLWYGADPKEKKLDLIEKEQHLIKDLFKDPSMQLSKPRDYTLLLARSYARYLCRKHGAASVQIVRYSRDPIMPALLFLPAEAIPPGTFDSLVSQFEEYRREN
jgi:hypothetical protein